VGIAYAIVAWLLLQVSDTLVPALHLPEWFNSGVAFVLIIGFPIAIILAWAFEMTPEGLKKEKDVDRSQSMTTVTGKKLNNAIIGVLVLALVYFVVDKFIVDPGRDAAEIATAVEDSRDQLPEPIEPTNSDKSIAVLPFVNMSSDQEQEYFSDGLSEELLNLLAKIPELRVAARTSSFSFKGQSIEIPEIASRLNVDHVLEGSVRKSGNQIRITAQLIQADNGYHLWSETYDRELTSVFAIQDEIATAVVTALKLTLLGETPTARKTNPESYALYLQARYFDNLGGEDNLTKAATAYQAALAVDPEYAPALAGLSRVYQQQADVGYINAIEGMVLSRSMAERAISIDPLSAEAWSSLGRIRWTYDWDWESAEEAEGKALELEPGNVDVISLSARLSSTYGRRDETIELSRQAVGLDPLSLRPLATLGNALASAGNLAEAESVFSKILELNPRFPAVYINLGEILILKGEPEAALAVIQRESSEVWQGYGLSLAYQALAREDEATAALQAFIRDYGSVGAYQVGVVYAFSGAIDQSFEWLERAYAQRDGGMTSLLTDQFLENLHADPRWEALLEKMHLLQYWREMKKN
jgi:TolB-like protein/Tfp pilus assembly protein PilF